MKILIVSLVLLLAGCMTEEQRYRRAQEQAKARAKAVLQDLGNLSDVGKFRWEPGRMPQKRAQRLYNESQAPR